MFIAVLIDICSCLSCLYKDFIVVYSHTSLVTLHLLDLSQMKPLLISSKLILDTQIVSMVGRLLRHEVVFIFFWWHNYTLELAVYPGNSLVHCWYHSGGWTITGAPLDLHDPRILAMAAAQRHFLEAEYDEYAATNASGAAFCRSAVLIVSSYKML